MALMQELADVGMHDRVLKRAFFCSELLSRVLRDFLDCVQYNRVQRCNVPFLTPDAAASTLEKHDAWSVPRATRVMRLHLQCRCWP